MKSIQALRERRNALAKQLQDLVDKEKTPEWKAEHQEKYDQAMSEIANIDGEIKRHTEAMAVIAAGDGENGRISDGARDQFTRTPGAHQTDATERNALRAYLMGGIANLDQESLQRLRARQTPDIRNVMAMPQAAMSTTTGTEGGYTVATEYYQQLTQAMKAFGGVRAAAYSFNSGSGADMNFPGADATSEVGELVGQNVAVTALDTTFTNLTLSVYKYSSKKIAIPFELLQDSMFDLESYINSLLSTRIGRITAQHFATGTGTGQPKGLVTAAAAGITGEEVDTVSYDELVDLEHTVDPAYRSAPGVGYMMHDDSVRIIRKVKDTEGRPIFVPGYDQSNPGGAPDRLMGRPIYVCQEMPTMAASAKSILFGDYKKYFIRQVMDLTIFRMADSNFVLNGQIGFVGFNRQGGNLIDFGGAVKYFQNAAAAG